MKNLKEEFDYEQLENSVAWGIFKGGFWLFLVVFVVWIFFPFFESPLRNVAGKAASYIQLKVFTVRTFEVIKIFVSLAIPSVGAWLLVHLAEPLEYWYLSAWKNLLFTVVYFLGIGLPIWMAITVFSTNLSSVPPIVMHLVLWVAIYFLYFSNYEPVKFNEHVERLNLKQSGWRLSSLIFSFFGLFIFMAGLSYEVFSDDEFNVENLLLIFFAFFMFVLLFYLGFFFKVKKDDPPHPDLNSHFD